MSNSIISLIKSNDYYSFHGSRLVFLVEGQHLNQLVSLGNMLKLATDVHVGQVTGEYIAQVTGEHICEINGEHVGRVIGMNHW